MAGRNGRRAAMVAAVAVLATVVIPSPAFADDPLIFPAGQVCDFAVQVDRTGGRLVAREFTNPQTGTVRSLLAGRGTDLTFTNLATGSTFSLKGNGSVSSTTFEADGSATVRSTGHNVILMFPTDHPAGPSTTLYVGQVVYDMDDQFNFTIISSSGRTVDICGELM